MATISSDVQNYFKLKILLTRSHGSLRRLFNNRYSQFNSGQTWNDTPACGKGYFTSFMTKNLKNGLTAVQQTSVSNGDSKEWDLTTLTALLLHTDRPTTLSASEIQQLDRENQLLKQLRDIRNQLVHHPSKSIANAEFNQLRTDLAAILVAFGDVDTELDKLKDDSVFESPKQPIHEANSQEALCLNSLGTQAHKERKYSEAIAFFTKATVLASVSNHDRAIFFSNMAASRLSLHEQQEASFDEFEFIDAKDERYRALQDAKKARNLWST
jgi:hypothetical protein